jgi:hypothetical protein
VAASVRCAPGFPRTFTRSGTTAEVIPDTNSEDKTFEVFVAPTLAEPEAVFDALLRQVLHTIPGALTPASRTYQDALINAGYAPDASGPTQTADWVEAWGPVLEALGPYPHAAVTVAARKTQTTRMLKLVCPTCGYTLRTTAKWIAQGLPTCHDGTPFVADVAEESEQ